jgi:hypothetical protein
MKTPQGSRSAAVLAGDVEMVPEKVISDREVARLIREVEQELFGPRMQEPRSVPAATGRAPYSFD